MHSGGVCVHSNGVRVHSSRISMCVSVKSIGGSTVYEGIEVETDVTVVYS